MRGDERTSHRAVIGLILRRLGRLVLTVMLISTVVFLTVRVIPGDPARTIAGMDAGEPAVESLRIRLGLDRPLWRQYLGWLWDTLRFDFGTSFFSQEPVLRLILDRFPLTALLAVASFLLSLLVAIPIGVIAAVKRWTVWDGLGLMFAQVGMAIPSFWLAILLLMLFSVRLGLLPLFGADSVAHWILPVVTLATERAAVLVRFVRASMVEELEKEYVLAADARGLPHLRVRFSHALRNALMPVVTIAGIQFGYLLGGAVIVEQVFSLPGLGRLFLSAIVARDFPLIQGGVVFIAVVFSLSNCAADLVSAAVNPRLRVG
ncbi:MAG: ABC transporter permease [Spirochaetaceae bacterium]|nr:MAG: ABC transporter permease [Spirochaetaceae bacterium]